MTASLPVLALAAVGFGGGQKAASVGAPPTSTTGSPPTSTTGSTTGSSTGTSTGSSTGTGGGWAVQYNANGGKVTVGSSSIPWDDRISKDAQGLYSTPNQVGGYDHPGTNSPSTPVSVTSGGSPKIRLHWSGSGTPPAVAWLLVDSAASWTSTNGGGSASNGFANDQATAITNGQQKSGKHVIRLVGGTDREWSAGVNATATATSMAGETQIATASVNVVGSLTDRNATLERAGGGDVTIDGNAYTGNTLLSWSTSDGVSPGPNVQSLKGSYGGTWSKKSDGTNDVNVTWSGASTGGYTPNPANQTPSTYAPSPGGTMPYADASGQKKYETWHYSVHDSDGTDLELTFNWICHYVFEDFIENPPDPDSGTFRPDQREYKRAFNPGEVGDVQIDAGSMPAKTDYEADGTHSGVPHADKYVGIAAYRARAGMTTPNSWSASSYHVSATVAGDYGWRYTRDWKGHLGNVLSWNAAGEGVPLGFAYFLDNESHLGGVPISPQGTM